MKDERTRNWTFIVYPDSAPDNWESILAKQLIPWFCSPLHDSDLNADESEKKPHFHVAVCFEGKKSYDQILEIIEPLKCTIPQKIKNMRSMLRYFIHLDNPEKHQYDKSDIRCYGGADLESYFKATKSDRHEQLKSMVEWIENNDIDEFSDLVSYAAFTGDPEHEDWFGLLADNSTLFIESYIRSRRNRKAGQIKDQNPVSNNK